MTGFLIGLLIGLAIIVLLVIIASKSYEWDVVALLLAVICGAIVFTGAVVFGILSFDYKAAEVKASLINREYNTNYTQAEVFYASNVINTIRELDRTRIEINGNIGK